MTIKVKSLLTAAVLFALGASVQAAPETYVVDNSHTHAAYSLSHMGFSTLSGRFNETTGTVVLDRANKKGSVDIVIKTASQDSGWAARDKHIASEDFLNVQKFPTITFKSDKFHFNGDKLTSVDGSLTVHGVSKPVTLAVTNFKCVDSHPMAKKPWCGADATATIKRSDFGVAGYVPAVGDEMKLVIAIEAGKK
ncbi:YceI family protein [Neisseriaceae bacterium TC5R-5]|nr:YceI family protein [Neisseriaceae bacterium TC5R-5]